MTKTLIIIRHAHRDKEIGRSIDNGLSPKGHAQALRILKHFKKHYTKLHPLVASSPKKRCFETVLPLVQNDKSRIETLSCLDEGEPLQAKIAQFMQWWHKQGKPLIVICSHGDWIPACIEALTGERLELNKGAWAKLETRDDQIKLVEVIQNFQE
ncbi:phosphoglycerate mutase family protein [Bdellovibrionota bacterium FG-1]